MAKYIIALRAVVYEEKPGSHTVLLEVTDLPSMEMAEKVSLWIRGLIEENVNQIGAIETEARGH